MYLDNQAEFFCLFYSVSKVVTFELKVAIENAKGRKLPCK